MYMSDSATLPLPPSGAVVGSRLCVTASAFHAEFGSQANEGYVTQASLPEALGEEFADFEVDCQPGQALFSLQKQVGSSNVSITVNACNPESMPVDGTEHVDLQATEEEDSVEPGEVEIISLTVRVSKEGAEQDTLFSLGLPVDEQASFEIVGVQLVPAGMTLEQLGNSPLYEGPTFADLDMKLQQAFYEHLESLGIDDGLASRVLAAADLKEEAEYQTWLLNMQQQVLE